MYIEKEQNSAIKMFIILMLELEIWSVLLKSLSLGKCLHSPEKNHTKFKERIFQKGKYQEMTKHKTTA